MCFYVLWVAACLTDSSKCFYPFARYMMPTPLPLTQVPARGVPKPSLLGSGQELSGTHFSAEGVEQRPRGGVDPPLLLLLLLDGNFAIPRLIDVITFIERADGLPGGGDGNGNWDGYEGSEQERWWRWRCRRWWWRQRWWRWWR